MGIGYKINKHNHNYNIINYRSKIHKDIYYNGKYHNALYKGDKLLWHRFNIGFIRGVKFPKGSNIKAQKLLTWAASGASPNYNITPMDIIYKNHNYMNTSIDEVGIFGLILGGEIDKIKKRKTQYYDSEGYERDHNHCAHFAYGLHFDKNIYELDSPFITQPNDRHKGFMVTDSPGFQGNLDYYTYENCNIMFFIYTAARVEPNSDKTKVNYLGFFKKHNICPHLLISPEWEYLLTSITIPGVIHIATDKIIPSSSELFFNDIDDWALLTSGRYLTGEHYPDGVPMEARYIPSSNFIWWSDHKLPSGITEALGKNINLIKGYFNYSL